MKVKLFYGSVSSWGFSIDFEPNDRSFTIFFIHWFIALEFWSK